MSTDKTTFALFFGNRGFFPASHQAGARREMAPARRRDAFCGKFSIMDVFCQYGLKFTALGPHRVYPRSKRFEENVQYFERQRSVT